MVKNECNRTRQKQVKCNIKKFKKNTTFVVCPYDCKKSPDPEIVIDAILPIQEITQ